MCFYYLPKASSQSWKKAFLLSPCMYLHIRYMLLLVFASYVLLLCMFSYDPGGEVTPSLIFNVVVSSITPTPSHTHTYPEY